MNKTIANRVGQLIKQVFGCGKREERVLFMGLDAAGKTTVLYQFKQGEVVKTIPTIGFNVETVTVVPDRSRYPDEALKTLPSTVDLTIWDTGGCDKMRPLFRHYYPGTKLVVLVVDANDVERMDAARDEVARVVWEDFFQEQDTRFVIAVNKMDLVAESSKKNCAMVEHCQSLAMGLRHRARSDIPVVPVSAITGEGMAELLQTMVQVILEPRREPDAHGAEKLGAEQANQSSTEEEKKAEMMRQKFESWLSREDEEDEVFLQKFRDYTLESWDHYTHLRIAFVLLQKHGRQEGMKLIFEGIRNFIDNSPVTKRSQGTTFHETMTYFWAHMVHYAISTTTVVKGDDLTFKTFLVTNPVLADGGLFLHYYTKELMLKTAVSRERVMLPDKHQLPSLLTSTAENNNGPTKVKLQTLSDDIVFLQAVKQGKSPSMGHEARIRALWCVLHFEKDQRIARKEAFEVLKILDGPAYHLTRTYFWLQMVTMAQAMDPTAKTFHTFIEKETSKHLRDSEHILKYYSTSVLASGMQNMAFPDKKQISSVV